LRHRHKRHIVDQELAKFGVGGQERVDAREVVDSNRLGELACLLERFDMLLQLGPAWEAVLSVDFEIVLRREWGRRQTERGSWLDREDSAGYSTAQFTTTRYSRKRRCSYTERCPTMAVP